MGARSLRSWLLLIRGDEIHVFDGATIPQVVGVAGSSYTKQGKWSHTTYRLAVAEHVRVIAGRDGWETGTFAEGLAAAVRAMDPQRRVDSWHVDSWLDLAGALGVTLPAAQAWLRAWRPKAAEKFDAAEAALAEVDDAAGPQGAAEVAVSFGSPTNRLAGEGYWTWPVVVTDDDGAEVARLTPDATLGVGTGAQGWRSEGPVRILSYVHAAGYHGGVVSMRLAVPDGCAARHERPEEFSAPTSPPNDPSSPDARQESRVSSEATRRWTGQLGDLMKKG